jgi:PEP-CTERM motif
VTAFQPLVTPTVPEPASLVLIGGGLLALAGIRRMRRSA